MDVAVSELRAQLSDWLARVRAGEEIVITERGVPVARLVGLPATPLIERLTAEGKVSRPQQPVRPKAVTLARARSKRPVADLVGGQRR